MRNRNIFTPLLGLVLALAATSPASADIVVTQVGDPTWQPVDFHLFSATAGPTISEFRATVDSLLPPPNHIRRPGIGVSPGAPHAGPYDRELAEGVARQGYVDKDYFYTPEFSTPKGVFLVWMNVPRPGAPIGSSPDFASGPIIPNSIFPIQSRGDVLRNGAIFEANAFTFDVPGLDKLKADPPFTVEGHSHFPFFAEEDSGSAPKGLTDITGAYEYRIMLRDQLKNGYDISAKFTVNAVPEPGGLTLLGLGGLGIIGYAWRHHRSARA